MFFCAYMLIFILAQFETDYVVDSTLSMNDDLLNTKYKDKLDPSYKVIITISFVYFMFIIIIIIIFSGC
jgi:hypothetical protein